MKADEVYSKLLDKQDEMASDISNIKVILARQEESLRYHIRRTELAEEAIKLNRENLNIQMDRLNKELEPVHKHVRLVDSAFKIIGGLSILVGTLVGFAKLFGLIPI